LKRFTATTLALVLLSGAAYAAVDYSNVDRLYWHRNEGDNLAQSLSELDALLVQTPGDAGLLLRKGRSLIRRGEKIEKKSARLAVYVEAESLLKRATESDPSSVDAHFWYGVAMGRRGETQGVLRSLFLIKPIRREMSEVVSLDPTHGGAHRVLGEILWQVPGFAGGDKKKALEEYETAVRLDPRYTANYDTLAQAYVHFGRKEDAIRVAKSVADVKDPKDPAAYVDDLADAQKLIAELTR
jgi:tetratricopeptide (TPR) repeat protein